MTIYIDGKAQPEEPKIIIRSDIPLPPGRTSSNQKLYEKAKQMEVGQCMELPYSRVGLTHNLGRALGYEFTQRKVGNLLRIWRTA